MPSGHDFLETNNIFLHAPVGLGVLDTELRWVQVNRRLARRNGRSANSHVGQSIRQVSPQLADKLEPLLRQVLETGVAEYGVEIEKDTNVNSGICGSWVESWIPICTERGEVIGINVVAEEVTPSSEIQKHLILRNEAIEAVGNGILIADASLGKPADAPIVFANSAFTQITGYEPQEVIGRDCRFLQDEQTDPERVAEIRHALDSGTECLVVLCNRRKDGSHFWNELRITPIRNVAGSPSHFVAVITDVTERRLVEQRLLESESRYRTLFNSLDTGFCVFEMLYDDHGKAYDYLFLETNPEFDQHTGLHEAVGKTAMSLVPQLEPYWVDYYSEVADTGIAKKFIQESPTMGRWFEIHAFRFGDAELRQVALMFNDITERKRYEDSIEQSRQEAEQARMAADAANRAKSEFLANMSHEIRTPLSAILGFTEILDSSLHDPDDIQAVETIRRNVDHLQSLLNDFLDLAKIEAGQLNVQKIPTGVPQLVSEVMSLMQQRAIDARLRLSVEYATPIPGSILADPVRLRQILINLLSNAIKFTEPGLQEQDDVRLRVSYSDTPEARVTFDVIDSGIGLTAEQQKALFQRFSQVDNSDTRRYDGTGLGLTISRRLARLLGGEITFVSERFKGSTFTLDLVLDPEQLVTLTSRPARVYESNDIGDQIVRLSAHIMVVDDRPDIRAFLHHHLEDFGATVESYSSGEAALAHMAAAGAMTPDARDPTVAVTQSNAIESRASAVCDVILLDMQMPGLDGYETASRMRAAGYTGPIVALTAAVLGNERERSAQAGCTDYLSKPIRRAELLKALSSHLLPHQFVSVRGVQDSDTDSNDRIVHDSTRHDRQERQQSGTLESQSCRILVVEDHDSTRQAIVRILSRHGYEVEGAASAEEARKRVSTSSPRIIFLDIGLPGTDGLLLAREFRQHPGLRESQLVCVSGTSFDDQSEEAAVFHARLLKPVDRAMLLSTITRLVGR